MAQEQSAAPSKPAWAKIFTAFKIALDLKKLLLAAAGILLAWCGWWVLSWAFYGARTMPEWTQYDDKDPEKQKEGWRRFKADRASWNLIHELAGTEITPPSRGKYVDAADVTGSLEEFQLVEKWRSALESDTDKEAQKIKEDKSPEAKKALQIYRTQLEHPKIKPWGRLRVSPWHEYRGENPYLLVAHGIKTRGESIAGDGKFLGWLFGEQAPVVLEPLYKFLAPIVYLVDGRAGGWDRLYLILVMLWTLTVWGFFGGAISRIAAVQAARSERITLREAILFTRDRFISYVAAPVFPMVLLLFFVILLMIFGWIEWIPWFGDLFAGLFWPVVLLLGFIMGIVLIGLVGWPLMVATISVEGTDSFDALSRSYSYVYQAPWQYLWYNFLAVIYGATLVFFVGFMASLMVFLGKWGVSSAYGPANQDPAKDREPSYLFIYAPTSFGWRDLLISSSQFTQKETEVLTDGRTIDRLDFTPEYRKEIGVMNRLGAGLVALWIWPFFLLVVGFGYSFFWSASTLVYFLMRQYVDDTEMDEVHQEEEDLEDPFMKPPPASPAPPPNKPGVVSLNVVEGPPPAPSDAIRPEPMPPAPEPEPPPEAPPPADDGAPDRPAS